MRISSNLFFQTGLNSINAQQSDLMHLYQQVASGQRMVTPADDPLAAAQAINLSQAQTLNQRFADNREVAKNNLGTEENTLSSVTTLLQDVKTRLVEAGNGSMSDADRATLSDVLKNAKDTLLGLANATDGNGQYLFSGYSGSQPAFVADASGKVTYNGDANQRLIQADQTRQIAGSDIGSDIFMRASTGARNYLTRADSSNSGTGLIGKPVVTDAQGANVGKTFEIAFSNSADTPPVLQYTIQVKDVSGATVGSSAPVNYASGTTTLDLGGGVSVDFSGAPAVGDKFSVEPANAGYAASVQKADPASTLAAGNSTVTDASAQYFGKPFTIEFDAADPTKFTTTFYSDSSLATPLGAVDGTFTPPGGATDIPGAGVSLDITGAPEAGDKITVQAPQPTDLNIFDTLDNIITALGTPASTGNTQQTAFLNTLASAIQRIDLNYNQVLTVRSSVGSRLNELDAIDSNGTLRNLGYTQQLSRLEDVDYYSATAQLQLRQSALEAAAMAFKQIQGTSLFNMGS